MTAFTKLITGVLAISAMMTGLAQAQDGGAGRDTTMRESRDFNVADYGAVGDGKTDDGPAIREAVAAAIAAGPGPKVVFEKKPYRLARYSEKSFHINLKDVSGITLEGNGAEIINNPYNCIVNISGSRDVTVRGFTFDCDPLPFTQGTITRVEAEQGVFFLQIQQGYDNPVEVYRRIGKRPDWGWGVCMDPVERKRKPAAQMHFFMKDVTEASAGSDLLRVELDANSKKAIHEIEEGDRFVITLKYSGHGTNISVSQSTDIRLENYTVYTAKHGMTHAFTDNPGRVYVKGVRITFKPDSDRLISTPRDGFHVKHNAVGPVIEDGLFEGMLDDTINISVCPYWVKKDLGENRYLIAELAFSPRVGNTLMAYTPNPGTVTHDLKVLAVEPQKRPQGQQGHWNIITLDQPIPGLGLHEGNNLFPGGAEKLKCTGLYNIDASGKDYVIRNNTFLAQRRHAVLARSSGGLIEGNTFDGVGGHGVTLNNEVGSFYEGPFPSHTVIQNNTFRNTFWDAIKVYTNGKNAWAPGITIRNNTINGWYEDPRHGGPAAAICLRNVDGAIIEGNTIEAGEGDPLLSTPIIVGHSKDVRIENNTITDERPNLAAAYDLSGVDGSSLVIAGNQVKLHPDFPALMATIPPVSIQLRGKDLRSLRPGEDTGAFLKAGVGEVQGRDARVWSLHPPFKNGMRGAVVFEVPADISSAKGIRFMARTPDPEGDGVALTVAWKPVGATDGDYRSCYKATIKSQEWKTGKAEIKTTESRAMLRFSFDCGRSDDTAFDSVSIANLDLVEK